MTIQFNIDEGNFWIPFGLPEPRDAEYEETLLGDALFDDYRDNPNKPYIDYVKVGNEVFRALLVPGSKEDFLRIIREISREQKMQAYKNRCPVSDGKGGIRQCPMRLPNPDYGKNPDEPKTIANRCDMCPIARMWKDKGREESLENLIYDDEGNEKETPGLGRNSLSHSDLFDRVRDIVLGVVVDKHTKYGRVIEAVLDDNLSLNEACEATDTAKSSLYKKIHSRSFADDILDALSNDPFIDIETLLG